MRERLQVMVQEARAELFIPPTALCTDNAAMAAVAVEKWRAGQWAPADLDALMQTMVRLQHAGEPADLAS